MFDLKQIVALGMLLTLMASTFSSMFIVADYYVNTSSYAAHCENKDKPLMHCNGKCQMMKKINNEANKDQQNPERKAENKQEVFFANHSLNQIIVPLYTIIPANSFPSFSDTTVERPTAVFYPPPINLV